ncbi:diaminopimelate epimerase [Prosthecomicrobium hirschii]|uniref:Diaminopimelate epimerase n=2 Tax=Prosthecodimorpha hirschii TaxID=665126 RepID=A0A0P6WHS9_9HYPH|nr:diaminopimelate epimerase [Prosthecomicrobium hirschii]
MNGLGNDFLVFDARRDPVRLTADEILRLADRKTGIGFDQMITLEPSGAGADAFMRIHNADSSEVSACGNATRCVGWLLMQEKDSAAATIETRAGLLYASDAGEPELITVDMGEPKFDWRDIPLAEEFHDTRAIELQIGPIDAPILHSPAVVNMGNPHAIFWVDDVEAYDLAKLGPMLEHHPIFPERANISLAQVTGPDSLILKVWERGAGLTRACGTGACAAAVAAARTRRTGRRVRVTLPGGDLVITWRESDNHVMMTGPVETDFTGTIDRDTLAVTLDPPASVRGAAE